MFLTSIILVSTIVILWWYHNLRIYKYRSSKGISGLNPIPFFGNLRESILRRKHIGIIYKEIYDKYPNESVIGIYRMTSPTLIIRDLDIIKQILVKDFEHFPDRGMKFSKQGLGDNLFHCDKKTWHALRGHMTGLFSTGKLKNTLPLINNHADQLVNFLQDATSVKPEIELKQCFSKYTIATIMTALYGININLFKDNHKAIETVGDYIFRATYFNEMDMLFPNILEKLNMSRYPYLVNKFCYDVVNIVRSKSNDISSKYAVSVLLDMKKGNENNNNSKGEDNNLIINEHIMAAQVLIFFGAGFGNNALFLPYTLYRLAQDQTIQNKLIHEIDDVLKKYDDKVTYDALKEMTYLDKVFSEVLRINSLTNAILRLSKQSYKIPGTDGTIDKRTPIVISPYVIHRDEKLYPEPDKFDPERFSAENCAKRHPYAYIPFGAGPRSCIGRQLAKMQFFVAIVKILSQFRVMPSDKTKVIEEFDPMNTVLATKGGIYVTFIPRKN